MVDAVQLLSRFGLTRDTRERTCHVLAPQTTRHFRVSWESKTERGGKVCCVLRLRMSEILLGLINIDS
jgi:hypothetical protein